MKEFRGKVAVITGAASGIGFGIAERCAQEGMKVVLAGINLENLEAAQDKLAPLGAELLCVQCDVAKQADLEALAQATLERFGAVHLLVNNAGFGAGGSIWESSWEDWDWVLGVNLLGIIAGIKIFVPLMLAQNEPGHIINTASIAGLLPYHPSAPYQVTKSAVVALTENLYYSLLQKKTQLRASVLVPGYVKTRIMQAERNRPPELANPPAELTPEEMGVFQYLQQKVETGISPQEVAEIVFQGIRAEQLIINTHPDLVPRVRERMDGILKSIEPPA